MGRLTRNSPHGLFPDWRQNGAGGGGRKSQGAGTKAVCAPPAQEPPPQNEGPSQKCFLRQIGANGLVNSDHQEAESAHREPFRHPVFQGTPRAPAGMRS